MQASFVILNANVITLNPKQPKASALAIKKNKIVAVGSDAQIRKYVGTKTKVFDAKGKTVVPGLVDCHVHMTAFGEFLQSPDLKDARSIKQMKQKLREHVSKRLVENWVLGGRWDHEKFAEKRYPTRWDLDDVVSDRPVFLVRVCGHIGVANSVALKLASVTGKTCVEGGVIELDKACGEPTGILKEKAMSLIWNVVPKPTVEALEETCLQACTKTVEEGLTEVHWIVESIEEIKAIKNLESKKQLPLRVYLGIPPSLLENAYLNPATKYSNGMVKVGFVKLFADGSLGSRTAALKEPYSDLPTSKGLLLHSKKKLTQLILKAHKAGIQVGVHAIGDRAVETVLDAYEETVKKFPRKNHRHRIEHCSVLNPQLIRRMKKLNLIASVQPHFVVSDFWLTNRLGKQRVRWAFPFRTLVKGKIAVISGSDCPVEKISPILGIWAAVAKALPKQNLTPTQALETYTTNAAYASFKEAEKGTIQPGKLADLTLLSEDPLSIKPDMINKIAAQMTIVDGKIVYEDKTFSCSRFRIY